MLQEKMRYNGRIIFNVPVNVVFIYLEMYVVVLLCKISCSLCPDFLYSLISSLRI